MANLGAQLLNRYGSLASRMLIACVFVVSGSSKLLGFQATVQYIASGGLPAPTLAAIASILVELGGGLFLIVGYRAREAAAVMFIFTGAVAILFHNFWAIAPDQSQNALIHFMKNLSMMGGLLLLIVHGPGPLSAQPTPLLRLTQSL